MSSMQSTVLRIVLILTFWIGGLGCIDKVETVDRGNLDCYWGERLVRSCRVVFDCEGLSVEDLTGDWTACNADRGVQCTLTSTGS